MFEKGAIFFLYCETPVHAGSGSSLSVVDLPIQRERVTDLPIVQASGLKGALREEVEHILNQRSESETDQKVNILFGSETQEYAGCVSPHDARVLLFPVRSLAGVFAWTTCPLVLERFKREAMVAGVKIGWGTPAIGDSKALVSQDSEVTIDGQVVLEEFAFEAEQNEVVQDIAKWLKDKAFPQTEEYRPWCEWLPKRLVILPDDAFRDFTRMATEVISRIRIDQVKKTVERRALWTEEHLPSETLLYAPILVGKPLGEQEKVPAEFKDDDKPSAAKVLDLLQKLVSQENQPYLDRLQLGGDETVGRGIVRVRLFVDAGEGGECRAVTDTNG